MHFGVVIGTTNSHLFLLTFGIWGNGLSSVPDRYHIDKDCHPAIPPTDTPTPDGPALVAHTHNKNPATAATADRHINTYPT